jgi:hypothetical protein
MGAAEGELAQDLVGIADEIAVGEKQEFDDVPHRLRGSLGRTFGEARGHFYVSHVDIV